MRLAAQVKGGFYPAHEEAVAFAASYLQPPIGEKFSILDPCAGQGTAIRQLGELLRCPPTLTHAIELDDCRADMIHAALPEAHVLAPADFFGCRVSCGSFSFIWLNPPFDYSYGGHRVEDQGGRIKPSVSSRLPRAWPRENQDRRRLPYACERCCVWPDFA